ncbi:MAG: hypothetical protein PSX71_14560 [bacterium]|nr:hypothetical protein [bacterium]
MKGFNKLVLATAIIAASSCSFAMQAMDDESLSTTTGQAGLTLSLSTTLTNLDVKWIDRDGIAGDLNYANSGAVHITPIGISAIGQVITVDAGGTVGDTTGNGQLRIGINTTGATTINLNNTKISVADAGATGSAIGADTTIIQFDAAAALNIAAGMNTTIKLGNRVGGHFLTSTATLPNVTLTGLSIIDAVGGGSITIGTLGLSTVNSVTSIDVVAGGLQIDTTGTTIGEVALEGIRLGSAVSPSIGDVYIANLTANSVITVTGH